MTWNPSFSAAFFERGGSHRSTAKNSVLRCRKLGAEVARSTTELKTAFEQGLEDILSASGEDWNEAIFQTAAKIGAIILARAVQNPELSEEILRSVRQKLD